MSESENQYNYIFKEIDKESLYKKTCVCLAINGKYKDLITFVNKRSEKTRTPLVKFLKSTSIKASVSKEDIYLTDSHVKYLLGKDTLKNINTKRISYRNILLGLLGFILIVSFTFMGLTSKLNLGNIGLTLLAIPLFMFLANMLPDISKNRKDLFVSYLLKVLYKSNKMIEDSSIKTESIYDIYEREIRKYSSIESQTEQQNIEEAKSKKISNKIDIQINRVNTLENNINTINLISAKNELAVLLDVKDVDILSYKEKTGNNYGSYNYPLTVMKVLDGYLKNNNYKIDSQINIKIKVFISNVIACDTHNIALYHLYYQVNTQLSCIELIKIFNQIYINKEITIESLYQNNIYSIKSFDNIPQLLVSIEDKKLNSKKDFLSSFYSSLLDNIMKQIPLHLYNDLLKVNK